MSTRIVLGIGLLALAALFVACFEEERQDLPLAPPALSHSGAHTISGNILGPDGSTICDVIPEGSTMSVRVLDPVNPPLVAGAQFGITCPANSFSILVAPGTYRLVATVVVDPAGTLPLRHLEPGDVLVDGGDVVQDIQVLNGSPLGGSITLDGSPVAGHALNLVYDFAQRFQAAFGVSGPDGAWDDLFPDRSPMTIQGNVRYRVELDCPLLGTRALVNTVPTGSFLFPDEVGAITCTLETGSATAFSHDLTRLVVTPMPGDIGGLSGELVDQFGLGWGVQFPVSPSESPVHGPRSPTSHLFLGGLLVGIEPDVVLSGVNVGGFFECGASCRDFGLDGTVDVDVTGSVKRVTWQYSDAPSLEGVGLSVLQRSRDGKLPHDYVMFGFTFKNTGPSTITFYAGFFGDWDVDEDHTDDIGFTDMDGQLMYQTNDGGHGTHAGTLLLSDFPISGNFFFNPSVPPFEPLSLADQMRALRGDITRTSISSADNRYIHAVGPITLKPNEKALVAIAIVAGENKAQLLDNARAAAGKRPRKLKEFGGTLSSTSLDFGETLVVQPSPSLSWDGDEIVTIGDVESSWIVNANLDEIALIVPRLPIGPAELLVLFQGPDQITEFADVAVSSTFTPIGTEDFATAPDISGGPFPMTLFIELSDDDPDHVLTVSPTAELDLTVTLEWKTNADLDILWRNEDFTDFVGNFDGASLANPEQSSVTVPAGTTYRLWFNKFDTTAPPTLALVTITSP